MKNIKKTFEENCEKIINNTINNEKNMPKIDIKIKNSFINLLVKENKININDIFEYSKGRDINDIIYICPKFNNLKFINNTSIDDNFYKNIDFFKYFKSSKETLEDINSKKEHLRDNLRRLNKIKNIIKDKVWLDFGCGYGGLLKLADNIPKVKYGIEIMNEACLELKKNGYLIYNDINQIKDNTIDVITLSHVIAHIANPIELCLLLKKKLKKTGKLIIETPNSNDALYELYKCNNFKNFISAEHLVIHNKNSLEFLLKKSDFVNITIENVQRYPLSNHLSWLAFGKPGNEISLLNNEVLNNTYIDILSKNDMTDTLFCICNKS